MKAKDFIEEEGTVSEKDEKMDFSGFRPIHTEAADVQVQALYSRYDKKRLDPQPAYQRGEVWKVQQASRLIESVILGVPLPAIYLSEEADGSMSVIDGQQRLISFFNFIDGDFALKGLEVRVDLNGLKYSKLSEDVREKIDEGVLRQITFLKNSDPDLKFEVFKRLNSGSVSLNHQEMRNCVYRGPYNALLRKLSEEPDFQRVMGFDRPDPRMKDVEYVLRFSAFYFQGYAKYIPPMKKFMDGEMSARKNISEEDSAKLTFAFKNAGASALNVLGERPFRRWIKEENSPGIRREPKKFSASLFDVLMWSFAQHDRDAITRNATSIKEALVRLMTTNEIFVDSITRSTSSKRAIEARFGIWEGALAKILGNEISSLKKGAE